MASVFILPSIKGRTQTTEMIAGSPSFSNASGSKQQQTYMGTLLGSVAQTSHFCAADTQQFGGYAVVSDNITQSAATSKAAATTTYVITDEAEVEYLHGFLGRASGMTRNFFAATGHFYANNSIGIGAQESIAGTWNFYLRACKPRTPVKGTTPPNNFFSSVSLGAGAVRQRLYYTPGYIYSATLPVSGQFSYIFRGKSTAVPPHAIVSAQLGYNPLLNDLHAYQLYENADLIFPTAWNAITIALTQSDYYVNNAPAPDRRNYHAEGVQITFTFSNPRGPSVVPNPEYGACYTADKSTHLFCYNASSQNACVAPGIFRPKAVCSSSAAPAAVPQ